jgi:hypothetical protein
VPEPPGHPRFAPAYEATFEQHRAALGLPGQNFDYFFHDVERHLGDYPWEYSTEVPNGRGIRMIGTRDAFPDIPPLYVYFRVEVDPNKIVFLGLSPAWSVIETI